MRITRTSSPQHEAPLRLAATLAAPYSGTTLFAILLARHSQISSDGEIFPFGWHTPVRCCCGEAQVDCPYYREAGAHLLAADGKEFDPELFAPYPTYCRLGLVDRALGRMGSGVRSLVPAWRRHDRAFVAAHIRFMENSLRQRDARIYVDGTKSVRRALLFADSPQVHMKAIHLVRDGRGFCFSYLKNRNLPRTELPRAARAWNNNIKAIDRFQARLPHIAMLNVRYEDLCRDMPATLCRVCEFLEVPYERVLDCDEPRPCHVLGNRMRLNFSGQIEECLRWQREFTPAEIGFLNRALGEGLERYHYGTPPSTSSVVSPSSPVAAVSDEANHREVEVISR